MFNNCLLNIYDYLIIVISISNRYLTDINVFFEKKMIYDSLFYFLLFLSLFYILSLFSHFLKLIKILSLYLY